LVSGSVAVLANPTSGSTFPVGVTTVSLSARDTAGNAATTTFQVTVVAPDAAQQINDLTVIVSGLSGLSPANINALVTKLNSASNSLTNGNPTAARNQLGAFENQVQALVNSGRLTSAEGQSLVDRTQQIIALLL
jgi:hypothetical protein